MFTFYNMHGHKIVFPSWEAFQARCSYMGDAGNGALMYSIDGGIWFLDLFNGKVN